MSKFLDISTEILNKAKEYEEVNPEIANIFEHTFVTFMKIVQSLEKNLPVTEGSIKSKVFDDLFGPMKTNKSNKTNKSCSTKPKESDDIDLDLYSKITGKSGTSGGLDTSSDFGGFNPNENFNVPDENLLKNLKNNINKVRNINTKDIKKDIEKKNKEILKDFKKE